jgi:hypothetical protein
MKFEFSWKIFEKKTLKYQIVLKSIHWEPNCSIQMDGRTGGRQTERQDKAIVG